MGLSRRATTRAALALLTVVLTGCGSQASSPTPQQEAWSVLSHDFNRFSETVMRNERAVMVPDDPNQVLAATDYEFSPGVRLTQWRSAESGAARFCLTGPDDTYLSFVFTPTTKADPITYGITRAFGVGECRYKRGALVLRTEPENREFVTMRRSIRRDAYVLTESIEGIDLSRKAYPGRFSPGMLAPGMSLQPGTRVTQWAATDKTVRFCVAQPSGAYLVMFLNVTQEMYQTRGFGTDGSCRQPGLLRSYNVRMPAVERPVVGQGLEGGVAGLADNPFTKRAQPNAGW